MSIVSPDLIDWRERQYVSQFSMPALQLQIHVAGVPANPDAGATAQLLLQNADGTVSPVNSYAAQNLGPGLYQVVPSSNDTARPSDAELVWAYAISGAPQQYACFLTIGPVNPAYDNLQPQFKDAVEAVWMRFADMCDSPAGGPNINSTPYFQAHWSRGRVAQLMAIAIDKISTTGQPYNNYTIDGVGGPVFPVSLWGGLLNQYTYVECVKHLIRSLHRAAPRPGLGLHHPAGPPGLRRALAGHPGRGAGRAEVHGGRVQHPPHDAGQPEGPRQRRHLRPVRPDPHRGLGGRPAAHVGPLVLGFTISACIVTGG